MAVREIDETVAGQASFDMANLCPERTGLPFVVFVSQRGGARRDVRVKLSRTPRVRPGEMITVAVRPAPRIIQGRMSGQEFDLVRRWIELNEPVLVDYWNGVIEYTEDVLAALQPVAEQPRTSGLS
ncbi:MAG TPA: hypothetical protein VG651_01010 [Stellaceae bacterium]|nr:hypothetical protein [Stellaceae bacterium]